MGAYKFELLNRDMWTKEIMECNRRTEKFGLTLSEEDAELLVAEKCDVLRQTGRIEFGQSIITQIIYAFCDSNYITQENFLDVLLRLQEIFFEYKSEMNDEISDEELLSYMRQQFDERCCGDLDCLESTCLSILSEAVRSGYIGYRIKQGDDIPEEMDILQRWDRGLYLEALENLQ
ncbi:MAG: DUF6323 family protein [Lachnospiraceae bacterium]|jgi:hypothetical protein